MSRERVVRIAMLAYPPEVRNARGDEMLDTALDVAREPPGRVLRESFALVRSGLRARAGVTAGAGTRQLLASVCAQGATVCGLVMLIDVLHVDRQVWHISDGFHNEIVVLGYQVLMALTIAAALVGYDRVSAVFGLAWIGVYLDVAHQRLPWPGNPGWPTHWLAVVAVPLACYVVMLLTPRWRRRDARRLLWLAVAMLIGLTYGLGTAGAMILILPLTGLFLMPAGSSLPLAFALALIAYGMSLWTSPFGFGLTQLQWAMTTAGPILLTFGAALRLVSIRRSVAD